MISSGAFGAIEGKAKELVDIAASNSDRLVINDILDVEKIEAGKVEFQMKTQKLEPVVKRAVASSQGLAQQSGITLELDTEAAEAEVNMDADRIIQIVVNLISNAVKFSPREGRVQVRVFEHADRVRISVTDEGSGIPEEFRDRIFQKFAQADASDTRQKSGTGLGLSISKAIAEQHGGEIGWDTGPGRGTTFHVDLPLVAGTVVGDREARLSLATGRAPRLLVCEDDADVATLIRLMLEQGGYRVDVAHSVGQARGLVAKNRYAAITMDLSLPGEDGLTYIRELYRELRTRDLPIVVVSAKAEQGRQELNGVALGVLDWLSKPIDHQRLLSAMRRATDKPKPRVLHVEDDQSIQVLVAAIIGDKGEVRSASSRMEAERLLATEAFDLVVLDITLTDGSGLDLIPLVNRLDPPIPVLIFSAQEIAPEVARQVDAALVKSQIDNFRLLETIDVLLGNKGEV